ncbi:MULTISPECIES: S-type pyocin domain-containing protein [Pseudomonas]|uniref:S-type pyocin domain-containing protein n=1 Tax=Pseudomonas TaxID=286 RepID=UPI0005AAD428|nr:MULTISPECIES: S-type pyocin domain-containing protein [Pseudomonas]AZD91765.1 Uropathogenic specific protein [Pseudomonas chlororaphis subsp. aureofaciens]KAB0531010.1 pyocin [Pseudomonas chlororaphis subsp. aureofaciens]TSD32081.1 pyocin [Pseudomonas sp. ATCC 13985]WDG63106.1 S-type pyocin domain-containing protein [Pseudomonas chlororaphis]WDG68918.1 S-type pyocin domain-containing protein [Pseudomonas chlororaphis]
MARNRLPPIKSPPSGDGHHVTYRDMTPSERAKQEARQHAYERMLARQQAYADSLASPPRKQQAMAGCTFTKSCKLPDGVMDYLSPSGAIPTDAIKDYGELVVLGGRGTDATGNIPLKKISGGTLPAALGSLALGGEAMASAGVSVATGGVVAGALAGVVALLWPSSLGDSALYTPEQLDALKEGRTRVRLHIEQRPDGTLKGYGYNTQKQRGWEMVPVVRFVAKGQQQVADFGDGVTLIWTPAVDPSSTSGIPPLEAAPQAPHIWIFPPTEQADTIIVDPIYPPEYKDFILVFPPRSGVQPLYIVLSVRKTPGVVTGQGQDINGVWLAGAGSGLGSPIPTEIADQLRGKEFRSFDAFRRAFWRTVGENPTLFGQFNQRAQKRLSTGNAPAVRDRDAVGKRGTFELHHIEQIADGGEVYNVDNLRVTTPKNHINIHRNR